MKEWMRSQWEHAIESPGRVLLAGFVLAAVVALLGAAFGFVLLVVDYAAKIA